ncbi:MAG: hypothetical protein US52_C0014G0013 [candidate division WS6 bacterium GW2011_GWA2_37_6]|uniref:N-acetyltransferase domain-containing protein n=1 Tax=candidate division WS6 bacterium GW2011_GWA2_37_6 TaxID=1619087 RepID=A0A0G0GY02_9BACT|nr:MAG: hypothetical protein US52_C0014G0013 [candidate division WS6 bacterium GW2011_GWA2_37_6]
MVKIIKPTKEQIDELMKLWIGEVEFHVGLDDVYYGDWDAREYLLNAIENDEPHLLVASENGNLVGFVTFDKGKEEYSDTKIKEFVEVKEIFVLPEFRGKGIGRMLLSEVEKFSKKENLGWVKLQCSTKNPDALKFYESMDYRDRQRLLYKKVK